jgi:maltose/moltooligosaccharide transporter
MSHTATCRRAISRRVAAEADAHVIVVSAYNPGEEHGIAAGEGNRKEVYGQAAARSALAATVRHLTSDRVRRIEQRLVAGSPAQALLDTAGDNPANLIVGSVQPRARCSDRCRPRW